MSFPPETLPYLARYARWLLSRVSELQAYQPARDETPESFSLDWDQWLEALANERVADLTRSGLPDGNDPFGALLEELRRRKEVLLHFLTAWGQDLNESISVAQELDRLMSALELAAWKEQKDRIDSREQRTASLYRQAEAITHLGNYTWNPETDELNWSDELFSIYGLEPGAPVSVKNLEHFIHPDDLRLVREETLDALKTRGMFDYYYRISSRGQEKVLRARGKVEEQTGGGRLVIGTIQDVTERQRLVVKLQEKEILHRQAEELANMGSWIWDLKTGKVDWSQQMYRIYELDPAQPLTADPFPQFLHPDDREQMSQVKEKILREGQSDHTFRIILRNGNVKTLHTIARLYRDEDGQPSHIIGAEHDISERQQLAIELEKTESIYEQAETLANIGSWSWDIRSDRLIWTDNLYRIYGLQPRSETITIEKFLALVHPDDRDFVKGGVDELNAHPRVEYTFRIVTRTGETKLIHSIAQVHFDANGNAESVVGIERDISDKQKMIRKLEESETLYKQAQALAHVGNWTWDVTADRIYWSDELYRIYGFEPQSRQFTYEEYLQLLHPDDRERVQQYVQKHYAEGGSWEFIHRVVRPNGETRILLGTGEVQLDEQGRPCRMMGTAQDITEQQELINRLQESEALYKQAQGLALMGNWSMDVASRRIEWSEQMYRIYETEPGQAISFEEWLDFLDESERIAAVDYYHECLKEKKVYDRIHQIHLKNGKVKTIHRKAEFICDANGTPIRMIGTTQDVTANYLVQQELKENQTFIRKITDATPSIIAVYNVDTGAYVFISEGVQKLLGYTTAQVLERGAPFFMELLHPDDRPAVMKKNTEALEQANADAAHDLVMEFTYRMRHSNGRFRWFTTYGTVFDRNADGKVEHVLNITLDVTEGVEATQKIKEQEHFIQQIADASPTILYLFDVESQSVQYINREIFFVLGYLPDEILESGAEVTRLIYHPEDYHLLPGRKESGKSFSEVDSMIQYECRMRYKDGTWRWVLVREIVFKTGKNGEICQILGAALDINRRKEMERTILQNTLLLEQSNASLEEFAYVASHDLKEPLRKISTFGDRLVATQAEKLTGDGKIYLQKIVDASQRMQTMISDLLSISMIRGNTAFERCSLQKILEEVLQTLEFKIEQQNAQVLADSLPEALVIPSQFRQLFQNLLSNSLKFVRPEAEPVLRIQYEEIGPGDVDQFQLSQAERYHRIVFSDNGIGFENEFAGKIFAIFQRLHGRSEYEGSGIGLAICKKIVEHHGGVIFARGVPGEGAAFTLILPA